MARITSSAAVLLVRDVVAAADYYRDCLGFTERDLFGDPPDFCIVHRDGHHLMFAKVAPDLLKPHWQLRPGTVSAYFWVDDADSFYAEVKAAGARIDYEPCTQPYGVREFGI